MIFIQLITINQRILKIWKMKETVLFSIVNKKTWVYHYCKCYTKSTIVILCYGFEQNEIAAQNLNTTSADTSLNLAVTWPENWSIFYNSKLTLANPNFPINFVQIYDSNL